MGTHSYLFHVSPAAGFHIVSNLSKSLESFTGSKLNSIPSEVLSGN